MTLSPIYASTSDNATQQSRMFADLARLSLTASDDLTGDYIKVLDLAGIAYYTPNDEDWGSVIAVDSANGLAIATGFYDTADFEDLEIRGTVHESDYRIVRHDGKLVCNFNAQ